MQVLVDKSLITIDSDMSLQMHDLIKAMAREIIHEEFIMTGKQRRLWNSSQVYNALSEKKVPITEAVEVLVLSLEKFSQKVHIDANDFAHMKKLRILKIYQEEKVYEQKLELKGHNVIFSGSLHYLSNELSLFYWHGCPFKYIPSHFYPENIVAIDLSYSSIKNFWTTPKCFRRLKVMKLRYCCNLTTTPDFSEITNLEELSLEGCVNLVSVHPSIGILKRLVVLNLRDCERLQNFPSRVEMDALQVLNLTGCLKVDQLPEALGRIKSLTELHIDRTAITELPSFVSSLINLESLSFGGQGKIQPRWWASITAPFGLLSKQHHPQRSVSLAGLHMLRKLNLSYCNLEQVPGSIGGLSCLEILELKGNNFTSLPGSFSQLSHLGMLFVDGCKKLEVLPEVPPGLYKIHASDCTSLREVSGSSDSTWYRYKYLRNCPKLFKNVTIDSEGSISKTECLDSSITSQGFIHRLYAFLGYLGVQTNRDEFFLPDTHYSHLHIGRAVFEGAQGDLSPIRTALDIGYHGNSMPEWFTNRSSGNHVKVELPSDWCYYKFKGCGTCAVFNRKKPHKLKGCSEKYVKVELPSDWCYDKFRGYGTCVVFKCKKSFNRFEGYSVKNFDGASLKTHYFPFTIKDYFKNEVIGIQDSYMIWLHYTNSRWQWKEAKNFVTFCFEENNEDVEVKECGVRLICDGDLEQQDVKNLSSMFKDLPTLSQHGGAMSYKGPLGLIDWSW